MHESLEADIFMQASKQYALTECMKVWRQTFSCIIIHTVACGNKIHLNCRYGNHTHSTLADAQARRLYCRYGISPVPEN